MRSGCMMREFLREFLISVSRAHARVRATHAKARTLIAFDASKVKMCGLSLKRDCTFTCHAARARRGG